MAGNEEAWSDVRGALREEIDRNAKYYRGGRFLWGTLEEVANRLECDEVPAPKRYWMSMPALGDVVANAYKRPVCYFSRDFSATFFPFFCLPSDVPPICFAFLEGPKHFIALDLPRDAPFPMPPVVDYWSKKAEPLALEWEMWYSDHKDLYKAHMPPPSSIKESTVIELDD